MVAGRRLRFEWGSVASTGGCIAREFVSCL